MRKFLVLNDGSSLDDLRTRLVTLNNSSRAIQARADAESRALTTEEASEVDRLFAQFEQTEAEIARRERADRINAQAAHLAATQPRQTAPTPTATITHETGPKGQNGFRTMGEFANCVLAASRKANPHVDNRLILNTAPTTGNEATNADGGYAVPPDFRANIVKTIMGEGEALLARCDQQACAGNAMQYPLDENAPWAASGIQAYWEAEMTQHTQTKPVLGQLTVRAHKLAAIVPMTDELLADVPSMSSYITTKAAEKFDFKINDAIINGNGVGQPMGVLNAACTVSVAKESGQTAATVNYQNVIKMWTRLYAKCRGNAIWLVNQDVEQQLQAMTFPTASGTTVAPYLPPGGISGAPYATIFGRPVIAIESMAALGTVGDIVLADFSQYLALVKGGMKQDVSMHLWFDYDITAFRFVMRIGGTPWWSTAVTRKNSSNSASPFITLATRS